MSFSLTTTTNPAEGMPVEIPALPTKRVSLLLKRYYPYQECDNESFNSGTFTHGGQKFKASSCKVSGKYHIGIYRVLTKEEVDALWNRGVSGIYQRSYAQITLPYHVTRPAADKCLDALFTVLRESGAFEPGYDPLTESGQEVTARAVKAATEKTPAKPDPKPRKKRLGWREASARWGIY